MDGQLAKYRIMMILQSHLLEDLSINEFKDLTDNLELENINIKLRDAILKDAREKVIKIKSDSEFELLELLEEDLKWNQKK